MDLDLASICASVGWAHWHFAVKCEGLTQRPKGTADKHLSSGALRGWGMELEGHCLSVGRLSLEEGQSLEDLRMV